MKPENENILSKIRQLLTAIYALILLVIGMGTVVVMLQLFPNTIAAMDFKSSQQWKMKSLSDFPDDPESNIRYGYELITNTSALIGPMASDVSMRLAGNNLTCNNCHLDAGRKIGSGSFIGVTSRFPQFRGRENKIGTMEERINGCMERSMNGKKLAEDSREMQAMIAYMTWLSEGVPEEVEDLYKGYKKIDIPNRQVDTVAGRVAYELRCSPCHGIDGRGMLRGDNLEHGYLYPPLGGEDTYNDGAGMHRVITAAKFIKANMPFGATYDKPLLTDEEAYDIAGYINTFDRPEKKNKSLDFPDKTLKPVSTSYGPWVDNFSPDQHKFGPFQPIMEYYLDKYGLNKTK